MKTEILHTLQAVLLENTTSYQSDFEFDVTTLLEAAKEPKIEDRTYYCLSRPCGTWCLIERNVFLKGSAAYSIWMHYKSEHDGFRAFSVVIEEKNDQGLMGKVISLTMEKASSESKGLRCLMRIFLGNTVTVLHFPE